MKNIKLAPYQLNLILALVFTLFFNFSFFSKTLAVYPLNGMNFFFLISLSIALFLATNLMLSLLVWRKIYKPTIYLIFFLSMMAAYVMDTYSTVIDENMLINVLNTDASESLDLITGKLFVYLFFLFIIPSILLFKVSIKETSVKRELKEKSIAIPLTLIAVFLCVITFSKNYASFFREQKPLRYYTNPTYWIYSKIKLGTSYFQNTNVAVKKIGENSIISPDKKARELVIFIVGETARRDRFSLNGYAKKTNPLLEKHDDLVSFGNVVSCGTSTAVSLPCMFSHLEQKDFSIDKGKGHENLLDVLNYTKSVNILWRDNNSNSKGVADRVKYEDFRFQTTNTVCDTECRDEGMLVGLQEHIDNATEDHIVIVLHQMGNHGPAYYKRYPDEFEVFKPACKTSELARCSKEEIDNVYDNIILYTDYFLDKTIRLLKDNSKKFNTTMIYASDHGESLGENGIYLHSLPYFMAPKEQYEIPMLMWFGGEMKERVDYVKLRQLLNNNYSHDHLFHTVLGLLSVETDTYKGELDILKNVYIERN